MKPILGYFFLTLAISCGVAANSFAKISDGFSKLTPTVACLFLMSITMFSLAKGMTVIPVGFAYATYSAQLLLLQYYCLELSNITKYQTSMV